MFLTLPSAAQQKYLLKCPSPNCNTVVFDGTCVGPRTEEIKEHFRYEPKLIGTNGLGSLVGSRLTRQIDPRARQFSDKLSGIEGTVGKVPGKVLKLDEAELLFHLLRSGSELEKAFSAFLSVLVIVDGHHVAIPEYCQTVVNDIALSYCSINGFIQLPSKRSQNLFKRVSSMQSNPQHNPLLLNQFCDIMPILGNVLKHTPAEHVPLFQVFLRELYRHYTDTIGTEVWHEEMSEIPPSTHHKYVITGRERIRQPRRYHQSHAEAERELVGIGDCKKIPNSTQHHSTLFVGVCPHGIGIIACPMSYAESPRFLFSLLLEYWEKPPKTIIYDNACHGHEFCLNREPSFFKDTHFLIDKFHYKNHRACSRAYNSSLFKDAAVLNSQVCEQFNKTLKKIAISAQYSNASSYFLLVVSFMLHQNHQRIEECHLI